MRIPSLPRLALISAMVMLTGVLLAPIPFTLTPNNELTADEGKLILKKLRAFAVERTTSPVPNNLGVAINMTTPMVLTLWKRGIRKNVWQVQNKTLAEGLVEFGKALKQKKSALADKTARLQLDMILSEGWVPQDGLFFSVSFVEGHNGVSGMVDGTRVYLPPSELIRFKRYGSFRPMPGYDRRFKIGLDPTKVTRSILNQAKHIGIKGNNVTELKRFFSLTLVEGMDLKPRRLLKGTLERPMPKRAELKAAVLAGANYLVRCLKKNGIYRYNYNPVRNLDVNDRYNWPRHAGVSYSLALVGRLLKRPDYIAAAKRALIRFEEQLKNGPDNSRCLFSEGKCYLGSSALGLLALAEYRIASSDDRFDKTAAAVARFLIKMQRKDGFFYHDWYMDKGIDRDLMKLYASQQAVLALGRYGIAVGDNNSLTKAKKGMDYLAGPYWNHFLGTYFFGNEHWTCLAAEELYKSFPRPKYAELCHGIGVHYNNVSHDIGDTPFSEDTGGMCITHMFTPHTGGTATGAEAMVSAIYLGDAINIDTTNLRKQIQATYAFLIKSQVNVHDTFWMPAPKAAIGGIYQTQTKTEIRIDTVQHSISAMVRGLDLLPASTAKETIRAKKLYNLSAW